MWANATLGARDVSPERAGTRTTAHVAGLSSIAACAGTCAVLAAAPFERLNPVLTLPGQAISSVEAVLVAAAAVWLAALAFERTLPRWRTPITVPWIAFLAVMAIAAAAAPAERGNAAAMTSRLVLAFVVFLMAVNGLTSVRRIQAGMVALGISGLVAAIVVTLDFFEAPGVAGLLAAFREQVAIVGSQVRASGTFQYPTIASMFLEVAFALGLGLFLDALARRKELWAWTAGGALVIGASAISFTLTRAGLLAMATSLLIAGLLQWRRHGGDRGVRGLALIAAAVVAVFVASRPAEATLLRLTTEGQDGWYRAAVTAPSALNLRTGETSVVNVLVENSGRSTWNVDRSEPVAFSYHWLRADEDLVVAWNGLRTPLPARVAPGERIAVAARVTAPSSPGSYRLMWDLVQEHRFWFSTEPGAHLAVTSAAVSGVSVAGAVAEAPRPLPRPASRPGRRLLWGAAAAMVADRPLFGVGPDNYRLSYGRYAGLATFDTRVHSNNMYVEMFAGGGLAGGIAFLWLCVAIARTSRRAVAMANPPVAPLAIGVVAALAAIATHGLFDSFLSFTGTYIVIASVAALAVVADETSTAHAYRV